MKTEQLECFDQALHLICVEVPWLQFDLVKPHDQVDALASIPVQPGIDSGVSINLQNSDELHLSVAHFWCEWFPCDDSTVLARFVDATAGFLSGRYRLHEQFVLRRCVRSGLQKPDERGSWKRVAVWSNLGRFIPLPRTVEVIKNRGRQG
jgi:hypothetical protein